MTISMSQYPNPLHVQIELIEEAMKTAGVWSSDIPEWIGNYEEGHIENVWQWLQFIHLPMRLNGSIKNPHYIAPQVSQYMNGAVDHRRILQLVIELDSITSTLHKS